MRGSLARHPEWPVLLVAAVAWALFVALVLAPDDGGRLASGGHHTLVRVGGDAGWADAWVRPGGAPSTWAEVGTALGAAPTAWGHWGLMVLAMMLPGLALPVRHAAFATPRRRRHRTTGFFVVGYLVPWMLLGLGVTLALALVPAPGVMVAATALLAASAWELTPAVGHALARCHRTTPLGYDGWDADRAALRFGAFHARACLVVCAPLMVALTLAGHPWWLVVGVGTVTVLQKLGPDADRWAHPVAVLGTLAAVILVGTA
ncbi:copper chaperone [Oerskovia turbata]